MRQPDPLVESIERQLLDERYAVNQDVVALRTELYTLHLLASHDRPHICLADARYSVLDTLAWVVIFEVVLLLAVHPRDDFNVTLPDCLQALRPVFSLSSLRVCFSIFPIRLSRRLVSFLVWIFVYLRCFLYDRFAFSTSTYFVLGRCTFNSALNVYIISYAFSISSHRNFGSVG